MIKSEEYYKSIMAVLEEINIKEKDTIDKAAMMIAETLKADKIVYMFGCGHSHILTEEAFYRAGGLVHVKPIFDSALMLHEGAVKSSQLEKSEKYGQWLFDRVAPKAGDMMIIFSNSGINGCPVEMAIQSKLKGLNVVAVTSTGYINDEKSRHSTGKYLAQIADIVIDTHMPHGDALVKHGEISIAPGSTVAGAIIWNMIISEVADKGKSIGYEPAYFVSGNVEGGFEKNLAHVKSYQEKIGSI